MLQCVKPLPVIAATHMRIPCQVLAALFQIQLPTVGAGKAVDGGPRSWALPPTWKTWTELQTSGFNQAQPLPLRTAAESEPTPQQLPDS